MKIRIHTRDELRAQPAWMCWDNLLAPLSRSVERMPDAVMARPIQRYFSPPFGADEDRVILVLLGLGCPCSQIAEYLPGRTATAINSRVNKWGLIMGRGRHRIHEKDVQAALNGGTGR